MSVAISTVATGTINADQQFTDSATITNLANSTLTAKAITGTNLDVDSATIGNIAITNAVISSGDSASFSKIGVGDLEVDSANIDRLTLDSGQVRQLSTGFINAFMDSATFFDSATITNLSTTH